MILNVTNIWKNRKGEINVERKKIEISFTCN